MNKKRSQNKNKALLAFQHQTLTTRKKHRQHQHNLEKKMGISSLYIYRDSMVMNIDKQNRNEMMEWVDNNGGDGYLATTMMSARTQATTVTISSRQHIFFLAFF